MRFSFLPPYVIRAASFAGTYVSEGNVGGHVDFFFEVHEFLDNSNPLQRNRLMLEAFCTISCGKHDPYKIHSFYRKYATV